MSQDWRPPGGGPDHGWAAPEGAPAPQPPPRQQPPAPQQWGTPPGAPAPPDLTKQPGPAGPPPPAPAGHGYGYGYGAPAQAPPPVPLAPRPGVVPLRPLSLGEIFDGAFQVMRRNPVATIGWAALIGGSSTLVFTAVQALVGPRIARLSDPAALSVASEDELATAFGFYGLGMIAAVFVSLIASTILTGVLVVPVSRAVVGRPSTFGSTWRSAAPRLGWLLLLVLMISAGTFVVLTVSIGLPVLLGAALSWWWLLLLLPIGLALVVAQFWILVRGAIATPALMLEGVGPVAAFRRAGLLAGGLRTGSFWRSVGVLFLAGLITAVAGQVLLAPSYVVTFALAFANPDDPLAAAGVTPIQLVASTIFSIAAIAVVSPFQAGVSTLLYVDHRIRREGLDVELARAAEQP